MRTCTVCPNTLPVTVRADTVTCSVRCRVAAHRAAPAAPPLELQALHRWVRWAELSGTKVPMRAANRKAASSTNPTTWSTWATASASTVGVGAGFVLNGDGIVCLDLDHALQGRTLTPWARALVGAAGPTWVEVSPSGTGLHVWGKGRLAHSGHVHWRGVQLEGYDNARYITVTGRRWRRAPGRLADVQPLLDQLT